MWTLEKGDLNINENTMEMLGEGQTESDLLPNLSTQPEKATHHSYLKDFRVEPCPLFKQHQCQQHRPYSCFYWHFANQRRRRPVRKKDFTFNYSADVYCTKYDENTGLCPDGDECQYLHRVYGDVERKYHLRYYKTALCVHAADSKGNCTKNGQHCAFAHGPDDLRNPIFDIRELQSSELNVDSIDRDRLNFVVEDPIWQDQEYVLANYKTELCKKPPRLCRQGYACPYYHNSKDKRRPTAANKYRSTPCPSVKHGDEWGEPEICESGDSCSYCHTRTQQQFHPEIYKSTRCNDMQQHGYCPRGPFCAFAHTDAETHIDRQGGSKEPTKKTSSVGSAPSPGAASKKSSTTSSGGDGGIFPGSPCAEQRQIPTSSVYHGFGGGVVNAYSNLTPCKVTTDSCSGAHFPFPPSTVAAVTQKGDTQSGQLSVGVLSYSSVLKQRHHSESSSKCSPEAEVKRDTSQVYSKAPGFEREQQSPTKVWSNDVAVIGVRGDGGLSKIKANLYVSHEIGCELIQQLPSGQAIALPTSPPLRSVSFSPFATQAAPCWTLSGTSGSQLEESGLEDLPRIKERDEKTEGLSSSLGQYASPSAFYGSSTLLIIPGSEHLFTSHGGAQNGISGGQFPTSPQSAGNSFFSFSCKENVSNFNISSGNVGQNVPRDAHNRLSAESTSPGGLANTILRTELSRTKEELQAYRIRSNSLEESLKQIKQNFDTWKRRVEEFRQRELLLEQEKIQATQERDTALTQLALLKNEMQRWQLQGVLPVNPEFLSQSQLEQVHSRLKNELNKVERMQQRSFGNGPMCARCGRNIGANLPPGTCPVCSPPKVKNSNQPVTMVT